ncbi:LADA_0C01354g1_1 [Lachancea dasiensis]|uniref:LADA_0C01354g1_1 n=1 Tax=Lachancea dasiensis TaxID=1072105 RepID=A0A1G4IXM5_9SACH|nr:LADA_0C01354g1_1 [Lachancea dasiensis]
MINEELLRELENIDRIHYKSLWLDAADDLDNKLLELFSFGKVQDASNIDINDFTHLMWRKLKRLTLLDLCCRKRTLTVEEIRTKCGLQNSIEADQLLMSIGTWVEFSIDQVSGEICILQCHEHRDVYNGEKSLKFVTVENSGRTILEDLRKWKTKLTCEL